MAISDNYYAVILAGGGGTRLWPKSRKVTPKHLLKLFGKRTMVQQTFDRISPLFPKERIFLITLETYVKDIKNQLPELLTENIIAEPQGKNTALAMGFASYVIKKQNPEAVIVNLAADQLVEKEDIFRQVITEALDIAGSSGYIVSIGIKPTFPHTGFGYIKIGEKINDYLSKNFPVYESLGFKEKPDLEIAQRFLDSGNYLWNANFYCWSVKNVASAIEKCAPDLSKNLDEIYSCLGTPEEENVIGKVYEKAENVQIDVAVSEKIKNLVVIPGDFGWNDVGDWKVIYDTKPKDDQGNVVDNEGDLLLNINSENCLVEGNQKLIAMVGLKDIIIVDTKDALLICHKDKTQDVKKIVERLKEEKKEEYL